VIEINTLGLADINEVGDGNLEASSDRQEHVERRVPPPSFDLREISERQPDPVCCVGLRPAQTPPSPLDAASDPLAERLGAHSRTRPRWAS
jgi:hypothetical protein